MSLDDDLRVRHDLIIPAAELSWTASRSGGPGGQGVNKLSTRVSLRWNPVRSSALSDELRLRLLERLASRLTRGGDLLLHSDEHRSQLENRLEVRRRLVAVLREALHVERPRRATRPTQGSRRRRVEGKTRRGKTKRLRGRPPTDD